jgi:hypothetical protein
MRWRMGRKHHVLGYPQCLGRSPHAVGDLSAWEGLAMHGSANALESLPIHNGSIVDGKGGFHKPGQ